MRLGQKSYGNPDNFSEAKGLDGTEHGSSDSLYGILTVNTVPDSLWKLTVSTRTDRGPLPSPPLPSHLHGTVSGWLKQGVSTREKLLVARPGAPRCKVRQSDSQSSTVIKSTSQTYSSSLTHIRSSLIVKYRPCLTLDSAPF
jgi:hypothetical protein